MPVEFTVDDFESAPNEFSVEDFEDTTPVSSLAPVRPPGLALFRDQETPVSRLVVSMPEAYARRQQQLEQEREQQASQSLIGLSPEIVPPGKTIPTSIASAVGKSAAGLGGYLTSPQGIVEQTVSLNPVTRPFVMAKWLKDMVKGAFESGKNAVSEVQNLLADQISSGVISANALPKPPPGTIPGSQEHIQNIAENAVNMVAQGLGAAGIGSHLPKTIGHVRAEIPSPEPKPKPISASPTAPAEGVVPLSTTPSLTKEITTYDAATHDQVVANVKERFKGESLPSRAELFRLYDEEYKRLISEQKEASPAPPPPEPQPTVPATGNAESGALLPPPEPGETGEKGGGAAHVEEIPETGAGGEKYGVAARIREERARAGQVDPVPPGEGINAPDSVDRGRELLRGGAKAEDALAAFEQNKRLSSDDMALVRAHGEALAAGARTIEEQHGTDSPEYRAAQKALSDWDKRSKAMQTEWHKTGMAQQGETDIDTGSFTGLNRAHQQDTGTEIPTEHVPTAKKIAKTVKGAKDEAAQATVKLFDEIKSGPDMAQAERRALDAASKTVREADIRMAKAENDARVADAELKREVQKVQEQAAAQAQKAASKTVREEAIVAARAESAKRVMAAQKQKAISDQQLKAAQRAKEAAEDRVRKAAAKVAEAERKAQADPIKRVWDRAKVYIEQGVDNFDDVRTKVATDLGMTNDQVSRMMARTKKAKYLADDVWMKQQKARRIHEQAKRWLTNLEFPAYQKALSLIPRAMFSMKVGFHGSVALGTHAPMVAFQPKFWKSYAQNFGRMYKLIGSPAYYERQVQDLLRRPNYITARRAGLVNDPFHYEEYYIPGAKISEAIPQISKAVADKFNALTGMGNRGYSVLKILRQDMFDQMWNQLPKTQQIPGVAEALSNQINHATGVTKASAPKGLHVALFAPRLEASRVAWLAVDPAKAAMTFLNWKKATPGDRAFAINQLKEKAWVAGTSATLLAINQGMLSLTGSDQKINVTDPMRSDFLKFKVAGSTVAYGNPMITMARMPARIWAIGASDGGKLRNVVYPDEKAGTAFFDYVRSQMSPFAGTVATLLLRADPTGRTLPSSVQNMPMRLRRQGIAPFTWPEFVTETFSPIPIQESLKDVWQEGFGMSPEQRKAYAKGVAKAMLMGATGARINEDRYIGE